jgi:hypothetical protein
VTMWVCFGYGWERGTLDGSTWTRDDGRVWSFAAQWPTDYSIEFRP